MTARATAVRSSPQSRSLRGSQGLRGSARGPRVRRTVTALAAGAAAWFALAGPVAADPPAWHVTDASGRHLWLLGSMHALRDSDYPLPAVIDALYERADLLVMELDLDDIDPVTLQGALMSAALLPEGTSLTDRIDAPLHARAQAYARDLGFELRLLERFEPWFVSVTLVNLGMVAQGFSSEGGVERYLLERAAIDGKEVLGLETLGRQIRVFAHLGPHEQALLLEQTLDELEVDEDTLEALVAAWRDGELETLAGSLTAEFDDFPTLYTELVVSRNEAWITELEQLLETDDTELVIVGALHLVGDHNVVDLLRAQGFEVRPAWQAMGQARGQTAGPAGGQTAEPARGQTAEPARGQTAEPAATR